MSGKISSSIILLLSVCTIFILLERISAQHVESNTSYRPNDTKMRSEVHNETMEQSKIEGRARMYNYARQSSSDFVPSKLPVVQTSVTNQVARYFQPNAKTSLNIGNGMKMGLDFHLPFFDLSYNDVISRISSTFTQIRQSRLGSYATNKTLTVAIIIGATTLSIIFFPQLAAAFSAITALPAEEVYRNFRAREIVDNVMGALEYYDIDRDACMKTAMCSLGREIHMRKLSRSNDQITTVDVIGKVMSFPLVKARFENNEYYRACEVGASGGDCTVFTKSRKCPLDYTTWKNAVSVFNILF